MTAVYSADLLDRLRAVLPVLPPASVFSHQTAATLYGFGVVRTTDVHVAIPSGTGVPRRRGITIHECALPLDEVVDVCGLPCLPPARCAIDLARVSSRVQALAVLDAALRSGTCTLAELRAEVSRHDRLRGVRQTRELIPLATPLAECRQETHMRLLLHDADLPAPRPQLPVADRWGVERLRIGLGYERERIGIEYDRTSPLHRQRPHPDRRRHNWLAVNGWRMRYFTDADLYQRPEQLVQMVRATLHHTAPRRLTPVPRPPGVGDQTRCSRSSVTSLAGAQP